MFGHEYCGSQSDQVHCVFNHNGRKHEKINKVWTKNDKDTHFYGVKLYANHTFEIYLDLKLDSSGPIGSKFQSMKPVYVCDFSLHFFFILCNHIRSFFSCIISHYFYFWSSLRSTHLVLLHLLTSLLTILIS